MSQEPSESETQTVRKFYQKEWRNFSKNLWPWESLRALVDKAERTLSSVMTMPPYAVTESPKLLQRFTPTLVSDCQELEFFATL